MELELVHLEQLQASSDLADKEGFIAYDECVFKKCCKKYKKKGRYCKKCPKL